MGPRAGGSIWRSTAIHCWIDPRLFDRIVVGPISHKPERCCPGPRPLGEARPPDEFWPRPQACEQFHCASVADRNQPDFSLSDCGWAEATFRKIRHVRKVAPAPTLKALTKSAQCGAAPTIEIRKVRSRRLATVIHSASATTFLPDRCGLEPGRCPTTRFPGSTCGRLGV
jgi:hypothetical protein